MAQTNANLIWKIADLLRGPYQPNQYGDVILPFTILRRRNAAPCPADRDGEISSADMNRMTHGRSDPCCCLCMSSRRTRCRR